MVRIILNGCNGAMGKMLANIIAQDEQAQVVAGIDITQAADTPFPVFESIKECDVEADALIDFTVSKITDMVLDQCAQKGLALVLATTGLSDEQLAHVQEAGKTIPIVQSYNMSLGINTLAKIVELITPVLADAGFDIEIVERHHRRKLDAPSGTAIMLGNAANKSLNGEYHFVFDRSERREKRDPKEIGFSAVRGGTIVGVHDVIYAGEDEVIELNHQAFSRGVFAKGAVQAAKFLQGKEPGVYTMRDVIGSYDTRVKRSEIRCKLACKRIFDLLTRQKHE